LGIEKRYESSEVLQTSQKLSQKINRYLHNNFQLALTLYSPRNYSCDVNTEPRPTVCVTHSIDTLKKILGYQIFYFTLYFGLIEMKKLHAINDEERCLLWHHNNSYQNRIAYDNWYRRRLLL